MVSKQILLVTFPGQGHINPSIQLAKILAKFGVKVTFLTSFYAIRRMPEALSSTTVGLDFASFSDGYDQGWTGVGDVQSFMFAFRHHGSIAVADLITSRKNDGCPFDHVIYTTLNTWVAHVARNLDTPATLLWTQPAVIMYLYVYYFEKGGVFGENNEVIGIPGLPIFGHSDLPSFFLDSSPNVYDFVLPIFKDHFEILDKETRSGVLLNSFDALEPDALSFLDKYNLMPVGPLIPSAYLDGKDPLDTTFGGDLIQESQDYVSYLDSKSEGSVVYVAFGSFSNISKPQTEEIAKGLIRSRKPFLWVIRGSDKAEKMDEIAVFREDLEKLGKIVSWCSQVKVLSHPSVGCFVTHCGWNSSLESLVSSVPVIAMPQWSDQLTNAKMLTDYWRTGERLKSDDGGLVGCDELTRCLDIVTSKEKGTEMKENAKKWRSLAMKAMEENGTSQVNLRSFLDHINGGQ